MSGAIIGLVPKKFVITLIKHQCWYEQDRLSRKKTVIPSAFKTWRDREDSKKSLKGQELGSPLLESRVNPSTDLSKIKVEVEDIDDDESMNLDREEFRKGGGASI